MSICLFGVQAEFVIPLRMNSTMAMSPFSGIAGGCAQA